VFFLYKSLFYYSPAALAQQAGWRGQLKASHDELENTLTAISSRLASLDREERKMAGRLAYFEQQSATQQARWESYEVPDIAPLTGPELEMAAPRLEQMQKAMDALGTVKAGIYALYTQLQERLSYLDRESQDVQLAKDELHSSLEEIDAEVNTRLTETAVKVESAFSEACAALLGGEGGFRWIQGEERGVDLWIQLPGKKPSTMSLLSGGEKALGGIAWLFALLKVRPSPFVVLDEVEAALDEANAEKVAAYIKEHHGTTQYVIVTHHKSTMVIGDGLWGVAGDGHGRSRLVSIRIDRPQDETAEVIL
jgi:chromosome segregation protein